MNVLQNEIPGNKPDNVKHTKQRVAY